MNTYNINIKNNNKEIAQLFPINTQILVFVYVRCIVLYLPMNTLARTIN